MTILTQKERNHKAAAISESHVRTISELGFTVDRERDTDGCFGKAAFDAPHREYTLANGAKIRGPVPGDLPERELREHFAAELKRSKLVAEHGVVAKKVLATVLAGVLTVGVATSRKDQPSPLYVTVANGPVETPDQPHGHGENSSDPPILMGRIAEGMFANVTATATTTTYILPKL
jgi:hypothetical protein